MNAPLPPVKGWSVGSVGTCVLLPHLKVAFDMGVWLDGAEAMDTVCITHGHMDHIAAVGLHCARRELLGLSPPTYVMAPGLVDAFETLMASFRLLDGSKLKFDIAAVGPGARHRISMDRVIRPFPTWHSAPSQGYIVWQSRKKLLRQYEGLSSQEIGALVRDGKKVTRTVETPEFAFTGDTRFAALDEQEAVWRARVLVTEATFLDDLVSPQRALETFHTHLEDIASRADRFENERVYLTHFSARYKQNYAEGRVRVVLPYALMKRVRFLGGPMIYVGE